MPPILGRREDMEGLSNWKNQYAVLINSGYLSGQGERLQMVGERLCLIN
jgi:hypothetical protein